MARFVILTHAVPAAASAKGSASSAMAMSATPAHFRRGLSRRVGRVLMDAKSLETPMNGRCPADCRRY